MNKLIKNMFFSIPFPFVLLILLALWNVEPVLAAESSQDSGLFEPFTEEEDYVFDEEYWKSCTFDYESIPQTVREEELYFGSKVSIHNEAIGSWIFSPISMEEKTATISFINRARGEVTVPSELKGYRIVGIGMNQEMYDDSTEGGYDPYSAVFLPSSCDSVTSVILPEGLETIGYYAFSYCRALQSIQMPDSLEEIYPAFQRCISLRELTIPSGVRFMSLNAPNMQTLRFEGGCPELEEVRVPETVSVIEFQAPFENPIRFNVPNPDCSVVFSEDYAAEDFSNVVIETPANSKLEGMLKAYGIPYEPLEETIWVSAPGNRSIGVSAISYSVVRGDTLWGLSRKYGCTVEELVWANEISNPDLIYVGQMLWVPVESYGKWEQYFLVQ